MTDIFHKEFYPTPFHVIEMMKLDCHGKVILEPSAGMGAIVDYCNDHGAKEVLAIEINDNCRSILKDKCSLIGKDFFDCNPEDVSHIDAIYINPPFSNATKHILHAWNIAPDGCEIVSLCNFTTISNSQLYRKLSVLLKDYGNAEFLGDVFSTADRKTDVEVGIIRLYKPISNEGFEFEGFFMDADEEEEQGEGIMQYNEVRSLVNRYVSTMKSFDSMKESIDNINFMTENINCPKLELSISNEGGLTDKARFSKLIQKRSWNHIFNKMNMKKFVTNNVMKDINKFVETQEKIPFTMKNIYRMLEIIVGTREETFKRSLVEAIDAFTKHSNENRFEVEGWKTNSAHMLNKKIIVNNVCESTYCGNYIKMKYDSYGSRHLDDITKVLCSLTGADYDQKEFNPTTQKYEAKIDEFYHISHNKNIVSGAWYDWRFFEVKFFKKGTCHLKFKSVEDWYIINKAYGEIKGFALPEQYKK